MEGKNRGPSPRPLGVYGQILLGFGAFTLVIAALLWVFQIFLLGPFYQLIKTDQVENTAEAVLRQLDEPQDTLRQTVEEGKVRVSVTDTGEGIPQDKLKDIWERYYKVDKEHKRAQMGSGLGLSIVKNILDMHGGTYGVTSTLGQGSTFWFELPVAQQSPESLPGPRD